MSPAPPSDSRRRAAGAATGAGDGRGTGSRGAAGADTGARSGSGGGATGGGDTAPGRIFRAPARPRPWWRRGRADQAPLWHLGVLALLTVPTVLLHEPVFGQGLGLRAAGLGAVTGLLVAAAASRWRWDTLSTLAVVLASHLLVGGVAALPSTTLGGVVPTGRTVQLLVVQTVQSWKDLLTLTPPASAYLGPAVMPWVSALLCSLAAGLVTVRLRRPVLGTVPVMVLGALGIAFGPSGRTPAPWPVALWYTGVLGWWAWAAQQRRFASGVDVRVGRTQLGTTTTSATTTRGSLAAVHAGRRTFAALVVLALAGAVCLPATTLLWSTGPRVVGRDVMAPPLDTRQYPSPLAAYRHYETDLKEDVLVRVTGLPDDARLRLGAMDVYDGTTFAMSPAGTHRDDGYVPVGDQMPATRAPQGSTAARLTVSTSGLVGPWLPSLGAPTALAFTGDGAVGQQDGLHLDRWAQALLTTAPAGRRAYELSAQVPPTWSDGQLRDVGAPPPALRDTHVPAGVALLASKVTGTEQTPLGRARAIERYLSQNGFYSDQDTAASRPGHRADRLQRMIEADRLIGDDEQYAALMALMLHSLGVNARVVMGLYPQGRGGDVDLRGHDVHVWVEVEFDGVGWQVFDPTPPRDQTPQTEVTRPRSVPRPQVLQPPEPPDEPVELPPASSDRDVAPEEEGGDTLPWGLVAAVGGGLLLLVGPAGGIVLLKALRRRRRRQGPPAAALAGSWDEVVDLATDAGLRVPAHQTRQEAAWALADALGAPPGAGAGEHAGAGAGERASGGRHGDGAPPGGSGASHAPLGEDAPRPGDAAAPDQRSGSAPVDAPRPGGAPSGAGTGAQESAASQGERADQAGWAPVPRDTDLGPDAPSPPTTAAVPPWDADLEDVPVTVAIARRADTASFGPEAASRQDAAAAWREVDALRRTLRRTARPLTRVRRALTPRSLWVRRALRRAARRSGRRRRAPEDHGLGPTGPTGLGRLLGWVGGRGARNVRRRVLRTLVRSRRKDTP